MVFTQTIGKTNALTLRKPNGKNAVKAVMLRNSDVKKYIDDSVRRSKAKTKEKRDLARQKAILEAMKRNREFHAAVRTALLLAIRRR